MSLPDQIFKPERYTYQDYLLWKGDWELVNGYPYAMAPSPNRNHQWFSSKFIQLSANEIDKISSSCQCQVYSELDWVIDEDSVVRPDCMIVCGNFTDDFLNFPPVLIVEISSPSTKLRDRNTKFNLYEMKGVRYYIISNTENKAVEVFELISGKYLQKTDTSFNLTQNCAVILDVYSLWTLM
ncbi:MAG: Uma2 family endonuclease [Ferruginibacter sp.]